MSFNIANDTLALRFVREASSVSNLRVQKYGLLPLNAL